MKKKIENDGKMYYVSKSNQPQLNNIIIYLNILQKVKTSLAAIQVWQCLSL